MFVLRSWWRLWLYGCDLWERKYLRRKIQQVKKYIIYPKFVQFIQFVSIHSLLFISQHCNCNIIHRSCPCVFDHHHHITIIIVTSHPPNRPDTQLYGLDDVLLVVVVSLLLNFNSFNVFTIYITFTCRRKFK